MADGPLPPLGRPERSWLVSFLYPLRGAESLGVVAAMAVACWVCFQLVPEYGLQIMRDTESMGASLLGILFVVVAGVPVVLVSPFVVSFSLQYLARVLVTSAMGETTPPRTPDRNFEGFFNGLGPWFVWLVMGLGVGLLPAYYAFDAGFPRLAVVLGLAGLPYIFASLMMSFLHDDSLAAKPWSVVAGLVRLGVSFLGLCIFIAVALGVSLGTFGLALLVRPHSFWTYLLLGLGCWVVVEWTAIVVMRLLGVYYYHRKDTLGWLRAHPRWGIAWKL